MSIYSDLTSFYRENGFAILSIPSVSDTVEYLRTAFEAEREHFQQDIVSNRNRIKRFADRLDVARLFANSDLEKAVCNVAGIECPVYCGPVVSHYTSTDNTGSAYGLPYHQDYPSMASSMNATITWLSLNNSSIDQHSVAVIPGYHNRGLLPGEQGSDGYHLYVTDEMKAAETILEVAQGQVLIMSPFLPHKTYINSSYKGWKLSLSRRLDDLADPDWARRKYANAYRTTVDRDLYRDT